MVKGINALVILAHDSATLTPVVKKAFDKGIYVVSVDRGLTEPAQHVYIAGDNPGFGALCAEWLGKALGGKGDIVLMEGIPTVINTERVEAFKAVMKKKYPGIKILDSQPAYWDTQKGLALMENYLQKYKKIDAVWAADDDVLVGVLQAYKESKRSDVKIMLGGAGSKVMVKKVMDGDPLVKADVTYHPNMIATGITLGVLGAQGKGLEGGRARDQGERQGLLRAGFGVLMAGGRLDGKSVLITGASAGIGWACAVAMAREGAQLVITARRENPRSRRRAAGRGQRLTDSVAKPSARSASSPFP